MLSGTFLNCYSTLRAIAKCFLKKSEKKFRNHYIFKKTRYMKHWEAIIAWNTSHFKDEMNSMKFYTSEGLLFKSPFDDLILFLEKCTYEQNFVYNFTRLRALAPEILKMNT